MSLIDPCETKPQSQCIAVCRHVCVVALHLSVSLCTCRSFFSFSVSTREAHLLGRICLENPHPGPWQHITLSIGVPRTGWNIFTVAMDVVVNTARSIVFLNVIYRPGCLKITVWILHEEPERKSLRISFAFVSRYLYIDICVLNIEEMTFENSRVTPSSWGMACQVNSSLEHTLVYLMNVGLMVVKSLERRPVIWV